MQPVKRNILLNPGPATTTDSVKYAQIVPDICPREQAFGDLCRSIQHRLVAVVHGDENYTAVMFGGSGTAAVEACVTSVIPENGRLLIIENGAYGRRIREIAETYHIPHDSYQLEWGDFPDIGVIEQVLKTGNYSHVALIHHETTTGMLNPLAAITQLTHQYGAQIIIDAMSSYAGIPIDISTLEIDYLISSSNKCIQGMAGIGFVICKKTCLAECAQIPPRTYYLNLWAQHDYFERTGQFRFTPPVQTLYALDQALTEYFEETEEGRSQRYVACYTTLVTGLEKLGFQFLVAPAYRAKLLTAVLEPTHSAYAYADMHAYLIQQGFTIYPGKGAKERTFRLANIGQLTAGDIELFLIHLQAYLATAGLLGQLYDD